MFVMLFSLFTGLLLIYNVWQEATRFLETRAKVCISWEKVARSRLFLCYKSAYRKVLGLAGVCLDALFAEFAGKNLSFCQSVRVSWLHVLRAFRLRMAWQRIRPLLRELFPPR